jgi:hypothetical protein
MTVCYLLFVFSPLDWHLQNLLAVNLYSATIAFIFVVGFILGANRRSSPAKPLNYGAYIVVGSVFTLLLVTPLTYLYSGKYPWQFLELWSDQQLAYTTYQERLALSTSLERAPISLFRVLFHPFVFSVLPLSVLNWRSLRTVHKLLLVATLACAFIISLARGTDRETADIVMFLLASFMILNARRSVSEKGTGSVRKTASNKLVVLAMGLGVLAVLVFIFFVERKLARYSGDVSALCIGTNLDICVSRDTALWDMVGDWGTFAVGITSTYMGQGFYGLSLAMGLDFHSTFGTGISPLVARIYEALSGDAEMYMRSYTFRMRELGWSDEYAWSTLMTWFANDLGFVGALLPLAALSYMFGAVWRDAVMSNDDRAAIVFTLLLLMFIYLPANNQIGQSPDLSFAFAFWSISWICGKIGFRSKRQRI